VEIFDMKVVIVPVCPPKFGRMNYPRNASSWNRAAATVLIVFARLGFVLAVGFIGYVLLGVH
jgi:hypothetical protein